MTIYCIARKFLSSALSRMKCLFEAYLLRNQLQPPVKVERGLLLTSKSVIDKLNEPSKIGKGLAIPVRCFPKNALPFELTCIVPFKKEDIEKTTVKSKASASDYNLKRPVVRLFHTSSTIYAESSETPGDFSKTTTIKRSGNLEETRLFHTTPTTYAEISETPGDLTKKTTIKRVKNMDEPRLFHTSSTTYAESSETPGDSKKTTIKRVGKLDESGEAGFFHRLNKARLELLKKTLKDKPPEKDPGTAADDQTKK